MKQNRLCYISQNYYNLSGAYKVTLRSCYKRIRKSLYFSKKPAFISLYFSKKLVFISLYFSIFIF